MKYEFIKVNKENSFYQVTDNEIKNIEKELELKFPRELVDFYLEVGSGFIEGSEYNINRTMDPYSIRDFRLRTNDFLFYPDIKIYDQFENNKLIFFEASESALMSIELSDKKQNPVYYYDIQITKSLEEFLNKIDVNDKCFLELLSE